VGIGAAGTLPAPYQGVPRSRRGHRYSLVLPDRITIFRLNVLAAAEVRRGPGQSKTAAVRDEVRRAVFHEIGHHFGLSEADLRRLGY
ncbi:MAG: metallopeptidase family protein, partial [Planctomycetia bacterium]|nr:metallopeptidase family protein [Planctomycetia bacterium]